MFRSSSTPPTTHPVTARRSSRAVALALAVPLTATVVASGAGTVGAEESNLNVGVDSLHFEGVADACQPDQALPCTPFAGSGEANVLRVTQSLEGGYHQFNALEGTSLQDHTMWLAAEIGAECALAHHLTGVIIDAEIGQDDLDGNSGGVGVVGVTNDQSWPLLPSFPDARTMPTKRIAINIPIAEAFDEGLIAFFDSPADVFAAGEAEVQRRIDDGMSAAEARALPYELHTAVTLSAQVNCEYNGVFYVEYFKRRDRTIPLTIEYMPAQVAPAAGGSAPTRGDLAARPEVTGAALSVVADPDDPCVVHLSGTIATNTAMDVDYRFVNPYGQPSNTYTVAVDHTRSAFVSRSADIPVAAGPDLDGGFSALEPTADLGDIAVEDAGTDWSGVFELEVISPNRVVAVDGFSVPHCPGRTPSVVVGEVGSTRTGTVTASPDPTH